MENAPELSTQIFSIVGFVAAGLSLLPPLLWLVHWKSKTKGWMIHLALVIGVLAFGAAKFNSLTYVNRIEQDRSEEMAAQAQKEEDRKKKMEAERAEDVANVRFVEDGGEDYLDVGGMDETDLRLHGLKGPKLERKSRSSQTVDNSLTGAVQNESSEEKEKELDSEAVEGDVVEPIVMTEENMKLANRLDSLLLSFLRWLIFMTAVYVAIDYLLRLNRYADSYFPLPIPGPIVEAFAPSPGLRQWPQKRRRTVLNELELTSRKNQPFLYFGNDSEVMNNLPSEHFRLPFKTWPIELLPIHHKGQPIHEDFIFEALWYGRSSFYSNNPAEAVDVLLRLASLMTERKESRAKAGQTVNIIWDFRSPLSKDIQKLFSLLGPNTGFSLVVANSKNS